MKQKYKKYSFIGDVMNPVGDVMHIAKKYLSRKYVLVTGCQRSGATLVFLILDAHKGIKGKDESESGHFSHPNGRQLLKNFLCGYLPCRKLPKASGGLARLKEDYPGVRIVWVVRHPLAVVSSMRRLKVDGWSENWIGTAAANELAQLRRLFPNIEDEASGLSEIEVGALIWKYNTIAIKKFKEGGLNVRVVKYEKVLKETYKYTRKMMSNLGLSWDPEAVNYEKKNNEIRGEN